MMAKAAQPVEVAGGFFTAAGRLANWESMSGQVNNKNHKILEQAYVSLQQEQRFINNRAQPYEI